MMKKELRGKNAPLIDHDFLIDRGFDLIKHHDEESDLTTLNYGIEINDISVILFYSEPLKFEEMAIFAASKQLPGNSFDLWVETSNSGNSFEYQDEISLFCLLLGKQLKII